MNENIERAKESLQPIKYESYDVAYYVLLNGEDMGAEEYCIDCIPAAVKKQSKSHKENRQEIINKFRQIEETGFYKKGRKKINVKEIYTDAQISTAKRQELKQWPAKASFTYNGHDPDFGGGLHEPNICSNCGEAFTCYFTPDDEEAEHLLERFNSVNGLDERDKWELDIAFDHYDYCSTPVKKILDHIANKLNSL